MILIFLVPYVLPYLFNPTYSQAPTGDPQAIINHVLPNTQVNDDKAIFVPAENLDHYNVVQHERIDIQDAKHPDEAPKTNDNHADVKPETVDKSDHHFYPTEEYTKHDSIKHEDNRPQPNKDSDYLSNEKEKEERAPKHNDHHDTVVNSYNDDHNYKTSNADDEEAKPKKPKASRRQPQYKPQNLPQNDDGIMFVPARNVETDRVFNYDSNSDENVNRRGQSKFYDDGGVRRSGPSETESPDPVFFISGKNNENVETAPEKPRVGTHEDATKPPQPKKNLNLLNCNNLNCDMTANAVCGVKREDNNWKYRSFKNYCFFRKVNCGLTNEFSRYIIQPLHKCEHLGRRLMASMTARQNYGGVSVFNQKNKFITSLQKSRRSSPSRRSLSHTENGAQCPHDCPDSCSDTYEPECAVNVQGEHKVFLNHCKLDYHSCTRNEAWYKKPIADCVGAGKAEVRQNRAFIGWMQRVGIVNNKGKLVFD